MQPASYVIGIVVYDQVDLLDVAVPAELFSWMNIVEHEADCGAVPRVVRLISADGPSVRTRDGITLGAELPSLERAGPLNLLWVPGADPARLRELMLDERFMSFLREHSAAADYTVSVCEGALLLAAAGLLDGYRATTHWAFRACLQQFPKIDVVEGYPRYWVDRNRVTGGGISSGLDETLKIISMIATEEVARKVQLNVQYHPNPPFNDGDPSVSRPPILEPGVQERFVKEMGPTIRRVLAGGAAR